MFDMYPHPINLNLPPKIRSWIDKEANIHRVPKGLVIMSLLNSFCPELVSSALEYGYNPAQYKSGRNAPKLNKFLYLADCPTFESREGAEAWLKLLLDEYSEQYFNDPKVSLLPYPPQVIDLESFEDRFPEPTVKIEIPPYTTYRLPRELMNLWKDYLYSYDVDTSISISKLVMYAAFWADPNKLQNMHPHHVFSCIDIMRYDHPLRALPLTVYDLEDA